MNKKLFLFLLFFALLSCQSRRSYNAKNNDIIYSQSNRTDAKHSQAEGKKLAISTQGIYSSIVANLMYELGGNAIDAAVAASFTLAVERPHSTGIGGGGFMLYRNGESKKIYAIDFRERAPLKASEAMFLDSKGAVNSKLSQNGILSVAVPGMVAGLLEIHQKFGKLPRDKVLAPAIRLARKGFRIYPSLAKAIKIKQAELAKDKDARKIFLDQNAAPLQVGDRLVQQDLAKTLEYIASQGLAGFYRGDIAKKITQYSDEHKGLLSLTDFAEYEVKWREALRGAFKGYEIISMPPPSSGGIHIIEFLNMLEEDNMKDKFVMSPQSVHLSASALQAVFADRARYLGDPDFNHVPTKELTSKSYAKERRKEISKNEALRASEVQAGKIELNEHTETTHFSIMDESGDAVSTTQTLNGYFGAAMIVSDTGILLNNEMDDFAGAVGAQNLFGAVGGRANLIAPKKTPLSSMTPTIVMKNNSPILSLGAPGGTRIISCVAQTLLNYLDYQLPLWDSIATIRYHHQWLPDVLELEIPGPKEEVLLKLKDMGHTVKLTTIPCYVMAVAKEQEIFKAVSDPRDIGISVAQ